MNMNKTLAFLRLMRPLNCIMVGFAVIVGATLADAKGLGNGWLKLVFGFVTGFALTAASMAINDYFDRKIDEVNEPNRPIPSGAVKPSEALFLATVLTLVGFLFAFLTSWMCVLGAAVAWLAFVAYTTVGKRSGLLGNLLVSACVAMPLIYGSIVIVGTVPLSIWIFAAMAFLANTGREITKGIVDIEGDKAQGIKTLAVRYGSKRAMWAAVIFYVSATVLSPIPLLLNIVSAWYLPFAAVTDVGLWFSSARLMKDYSRESARKVKNNVLLLLLVGLLAFIAGSVG
jgi:geranylgeranylglycerol-phosphate geranylgeranyltransferase